MNTVRSHSNAQSLLSIASPTPPSSVPDVTSRRILLAGGCQTLGFPVGPELGFTNVALQRLGNRGMPLTAEQFGYVSLFHSERLIAVVRRADPDILVLQLANYETCLRITRRVRRALTRFSSPSQSRNPVPRDWLPQPRMVVRRDLSWRIGTAGRLLVDNLSGHRLVDLSSLYESIPTFFDDVARLCVPATIVLGPLPCADPAVLYYRQRLAPTLESACAERGFTYINTMGFLRDHLGLHRESEAFADRIHLSTTGHRLLGELLADAIWHRVR